MLSSFDKPTTMRTIRSRGLVLSLTLALAGSPPTSAAAGPAPRSPATTAATPTTRDPTAQAAYTEALALVEAHEYGQAISRLDLAAEIEPTWSDPVRLRAEVFGVLAARYHPSAAMMNARMADLQRLLALEPGIDTQARQQEIAALQRQSRKAGEIEQTRRDLAPIALVLATLTGALLISGAMLYGMKPNDFLKPTAYRHERRNAAGLAMLTAGVVLAPHAITIGVFSGRQARHDAELRNLGVQTGRPLAAFGLSPQYVPGGGALGFSMRF